MKRSDPALAALLTITGVLHFVRPEPFEQIVPPALGSPRFWVLSSGLAELLVAAGLWHPRTRKRSALAAMVLFVAVFPANIYMAVDRSATDVPAWISWARLPLQPVLIWWAYRVSKEDL